MHSSTPPLQQHKKKYTTYEIKFKIKIKLNAGGWAINKMGEGNFVARVASFG